MRKLLFLVVALVMLIALPASALDLGKLTLTVQPVDYVSALAGIAKPVSKTYAANERYAVAVTAAVAAAVELPFILDILKAALAALAHQA